MEVILLDHVSSLGFAGDIVKVRNGYARNYLLPKKKAVIADRNNVTLFQHQKKLLEVTKSQKKQEAETFKKKIEALLITVQHAVGEGDKLYGSVSATEIQEKLKEQSFEIDRKLIKIETPLKTLGDHTVEIILHQEVSARVKVRVENKAAKETPVALEESVEVK